MLGFVVVGVVYSGGDALWFVCDYFVDLILFDFNLLDWYGLEVCCVLCSVGVECDVIVVMSNCDLVVVCSVVLLGVV